MLESIVKKNGNLNKLIDSIPYKQISVFGCGLNERLAIVDSLDSFIVYIVENIDTAIKINAELENQGKNSRIYSPDFNYSSSTIYSYSKINTLLNELIFGDINALVVPIGALTYKIPNKETFEDYLHIEKDTEYSRTDLISKLHHLDYKQVEQIESIGEYRVFGDMLDIFPICHELPIRISFFDDEVEDIYAINFEYNKVNTYQKIDILNNCFAKNIDFEKLNTEVKNALTKAKDNVNIDALNNILNATSMGRINPFLHVYSSNISGSIFDYLPKDYTIVIDDAKLIYDTLDSNIKENKEYIDENISSGTMINSHKDIFYSMNDICNNIKNHDSVIAFQMLTQANRFFNPQMVFSLKSIPVGNYVNKSAVLVNDVSSFLATKNTVILCVKSKDNIEYFEKILNANRISFVETNTVRNIILNTVNIIPITYGISFGFRDENFVVIGSNSLFGEKINIPTKRTKQTKVLDFVPEINDYVVHETHGVGKYVGIENLHVNNTQKDYLVIEYKNNDRLYLPVEYTNRLTKYVGGEDSPKLNKLGGVEFANIKSKVKSSLKELAFSLVELYQKRDSSKGFIYKREEELETAFKESFPYQETPDQEKAIADIDNDMEKGKVMDRLICGDVGYGKTEVAIRAIFKTVIHGKQCMFMCPTTVLSQQHYNTCLSRLQDFGIKVEVLNRFKTKAQVSDILDRLSKGEIDVLCGTHRLLSKDVVFKDLGLLVLDEEQKFGVGDKEKIKNIKSNINVLTLSATPIPRTLHMSMVGIRDISVISTPPESRLNVATTVTEYSDELLKNAITNELNRGGQTLVIYNRVEDIYAISSHIRDMFDGEVIVDVAHGQMGQEVLENAIYNLYNGKTQVLVATTLIENGVDLPNANTLFVLDADKLGLSQLYQLKGRVGRNNIQAYAYFTYMADKILNSDSYKRLEAIVEYSDMGSGYKIAMRDLEIRGAGNVLGPEQHGHMVKVGYAMYMALLNQAINEVKGESTKELIEKIDTKIDVNIPAYMPEDYISDTNQKTTIYSEISNIGSSTDLINLVSKLKEEYVDIPYPLINLMKVALIKNICTKLNVENMKINSTKATMQFRDNKDVLTDKVSDALNVYSMYTVLNLSNLPIIEFDTKSQGDVLDIIIEFLNYII